MNRPMSLTSLVAALAVAAIGIGPRPARPVVQATAGTVTVYKSPTCGCCKKWVEHMRAAGFTVDAKDIDNVDAIKDRYGVPQALSACHTALVNGHVIEGHVPADIIRKFLKERPKAVGIAVPGMPSGSPGMESAFFEHYEVISFDRRGNTAVYAKR